MKTNRIMLLILALLSVMLVQNAQAFYNPSTGRWLSRDPIGEQGGLNLVVPTKNNLVGYIDLLGLSLTVPDPNQPHIPAPNGPKPANAAEQKNVNDIGNKHGCWECGSPTPGTKSGNWIGDHQPSKALGNPQSLYAHCDRCSRRQGGNVSALVRSQNNSTLRGAAKVSAALVVLDVLNSMTDSAMAAQANSKYDKAMSACESAAGKSGLDAGCGCCVVGVSKTWTSPSRGPNWFERFVGQDTGYGPSGESTIKDVSGKFYSQPCDEVHDSGIWRDEWTTYESNKISY